MFHSYVAFKMFKTLEMPFHTYPQKAARIALSRIVLSVMYSLRYELLHYENFIAVCTV